MATQIKVNSATGNVTVQLSRTVIGTVVTANTANYANFAGTAETANNLNAATPANVVIGGGTNGYVLQTNGAGTTSWVAQAGGGGTQPGGANTEVQYNDAGTMAGDPAFTFNDVTSTLTTGTISATNIGNITPTNLDGNTANYLDGTGTFAPVVAASATTAEQVIRLCKAVQIVTKGQAVTITGGTGDNPDVNLADASSTVLMPAIGIALEDIALNALGNIALYGEVAGIDTTAFSVGDSVYISATIPGALTDTSPKGETNLVQKVGKVVRDNANGIVMVQGAGRSNETPNLDSGNIFLGDAFNQATTATLNTSIVPENTNLYYTDGRSRAALSTTTTAASGDGALAYDNGTGVFTFTPADAGASDYGDSNVVTLLDAFGSNTITTSGNITAGNLDVNGTTGHMSFVPDTEVINSKRFTTVNYATATVTLTAGSFLIGEAYTIVTTGTTDFTLIGASNSNPGTEFVATGVGTGTGTAKYENDSSQAFVTDNYINKGSASLQSFANTAAGQTAQGGTISFNSYNAIGNGGTDPLVPSILTLTGTPQSANLANSSTGTRTTMQITGGGADGFLTVIGSGAGDTYGSEAWKQFQYRPKAMGFIRRNGNSDSRQSPVANDETSLNFYNTQTLNSNPGILYNYPAKIGSKVDPGWTDPNSAAKATPSGVFFTVVSEDSANLEHRMYANGTTTFNSSSDSFGTPIATNPVSIGLNGTVTANAFTATTGVFTGDGGGLSNVSASLTGDGYQLANLTGANVTGEVGFSAVANSVAYANVSGTPTLGNIATINIDGDAANILYGNGVFAPAGAAGIQSQIANGTSNVDIAASNGNVDITVNGNTSVIATAISAIVQNEPAGNITISPGLTSAVYGAAGYVSHQYQAASMKFIRRDGNSTNKVSPVADTETSLDFYTTQTSSGNPGTVYQYPAKIGSKVDPIWTDPNNPAKATPSGLFFKVVSENSANLEHRMYANGTTTFNASSDSFGTPVATNPVSFGLNGTVTANAFTATTGNITATAGQFVGDAGGLSNVSVTPAGFNDSVQFNDNGSLGGDATLTYSTGGKNLTLNGTAGTTSGMPTININNGGLTVVQEEIGGGQESFSFKNFYAGKQIAPSSYFRARGTFAAQTAVAIGDQVLNEGYNVNGGAAAPFKNVGSVSASIVSNDGAGNIGLNYTINTKGPDVFENDKIQLDASRVTMSGNVTMTGSTTDTRMRVRRFAQEVSTLATLPTVGLSIGERAFISDAPVGTTPVFTTVATAGGTRLAPVYWDGTDWRFG